MADREVTVKLELDNSGFLAKLREAQAATDRFGSDGARSADTLDKSVTNLTKDVDTHTRSLGVADQWSRSVSASQASLGDAVEATGGRFRRSGDEVESFRTRLRNLFADSDRGAAGIGGIFGGLFSGTGGGIFNWLANPISSGAIGNITKDISALFQAMPWQLQVAVGAGLVAAAVAASSLITSTVAAAVLLGVGGGALAGGIALAFDNSTVRFAAKNAMEMIMQMMEDTANYRLGPVLARVVTTLGATILSLRPAIDATFAALAPSVTSLGAGIGGMLTGLLNSPGWAAGMVEANRLLSQLGDKLPSVGNALGTFIGQIAAAGPAAEKALTLIINLFNGIVMGTGAVIQGLGWVFDKVTSLPPALAVLSPAAELLNLLTGAGDHTSRSLQHLNTAAADSAQAARDAAGAYAALTAPVEKAGLGAQLTGDQFKAFAAQIKATRQDTDAFAALMSGRLFDAMMSVDSATLSFEKSQRLAGEAILQNSKDLNIHSKAGQDNRAAILGAVQANMAQYQANISSGMSAVIAAGQYDMNTESLYRTLQAAGLTAGAIDEIIGKYKHVPGNVNTYMNTFGLQAAIDNLSRVLSLVNNLSDRGTVELWFHGNVTGDFPMGDYGGGGRPRSNDPAPVFRSNAPRAQALGGIVAAADGMIATSPTVLFGERRTGMEAYIPQRGISANRAADLLGIAASWYGMNVTPRGGDGASAMGAAGYGVTSYVDNRTINYTINNATDPVAVVDAIKKFEQTNGRTWRGG